MGSDFFEQQQLKRQAQELNALDARIKSNIKLRDETEKDLDTERDPKNKHRHRNDITKYNDNIQKLEEDYNKRLETYNKRLETYNKKLETYNKKLEIHNNTTRKKNKKILISIASMISGIFLCIGIIYLRFGNSKESVDSDRTFSKPSIISENIVSTDSEVIRNIALSNDYLHLIVLYEDGNLERYEIKDEHSCVKEYCFHKDNVKYQEKRIQDFLTEEEKDAAGTESIYLFGESHNELLLVFNSDSSAKLKRTSMGDEPYDYHLTCELEDSDFGTYYVDSSDDHKYLVIASDSEKKPSLHTFELPARSINDINNNDVCNQIEGKSTFPKKLYEGNRITAIDFNPNPDDGWYFATAQKTGIVSLWKIEEDPDTTNPSLLNPKDLNPSKPFRIESKIENIISISFNKTGEMLAVGYKNGDFKLFDIDYEKLELIEKSKQSTESEGVLVAFSKFDSNILIVATNAESEGLSKIQHWDIRDLDKDPQTYDSIQARITHIKTLPTNQANSFGTILFITEDQNSIRLQPLCQPGSCTY